MEYWGMGLAEVTAMRVDMPVHEPDERPDRPAIDAVEAFLPFGCRLHETAATQSRQMMAHCGLLKIAFLHQLRDGVGALEETEEEIDPSRVAEGRQEDLVSPGKHT